MKLPLATFSFVLLSGAIFAQENYSAKSLFFGENDSVIAVSTAQKETTAIDGSGAVIASKKIIVQKALTQQVAQKKSKSPQNIGASYFIRLKNSDGSTSDVLATRKFKTGERFQLAIRVNRPSYIYVLNEAPSGKVTQIYPQPGVDNFVDAMGTVFLPAKGAFEFDREPGTEQLLVYVSTTTMVHDMSERVSLLRPDVITASSMQNTALSSCAQPAVVTNAVLPVPSTTVQLASAEVYASKGIKFSEDVACTQVVAKGENYASKGIVFSEDSAVGGLQPASYVVKESTNPEAALFLKIRLDHQ